MELDREVDIRDYIRIIRRRLWIILGVFGVSLILTFLYFIYSPPLFGDTNVPVVFTDVSSLIQQDLSLAQLRDHLLQSIRFLDYDLPFLFPVPV